MAEEKRFETRIKRYLEAKGCWNVKFFANSYTRSGVPDILACVGGYFVAIEVKAQTGKPSELQLYHIEQIRKSGGFAFVVYPSGWEQLKAFIDDLIKGYFSEEITSKIILK